VPLAYVQTFVAQGATMTIDGTGFANALGSLFAKRVRRTAHAIVWWYR
jgi:hypothetical protein